MKKLIVCIAGLLSASTVFSQRVADARLATLLQEKDSVALQTRLLALGSGDKEEDLKLLVNYYNQRRMAGKADSALTLAKQRFPKGEYALIAASNNVITAKSMEEKEVLLRELKAAFPGKEEAIANGYVYFDMAYGYARAGNTGKALDYLGQLKNEMVKGELIALMSEELLKAGKTDTAALLLTQGMEKLKDTASSTTATAPGQPGRNGQAQYIRYAVLYSKVLYAQGDYDAAWRYILDAYEKSNKKNAAVNEQYLVLLMKRQDYVQALPLLEAAFRKGESTPDMKTQLQLAYSKQGGKPGEFNHYLDTLRAALRTQMRRKASETLIDTPAYSFVLKNLDGKQVNLATLKGKIVILDFWATWCGPCKRSFPAMQMAVDKYSKDKDVRFLFIDTWEHKPDAKHAVASFIKENKYSFEVLLDEKDSAAKADKVVAGYGVTGIPAKFIIDQKGHIRFKLTGFSGSNDLAVEELSAMIDLLKAAN